MPVYEAVKGRQLEIPVLHVSGTTGLTLGSFTLLAMHAGSRVADPTTDWSLSLSEVDASNLPGWYRLLVTYPTVGTFTLRISEGAYSEDIIANTAEEGVDLLGAALYGALGDYVITVNDGSDPVQGVDVRVFDSAGTTLKARGSTDGSGQVVFPLPAGTYQTRYFKEGYDFSSSNPTSITVEANAVVPPVLTALIPTIAAEGDTIAVLGQHLSEDTEILFDGTAESITAVSFDRSVVVVDVSTGLVNTLVQVSARKPDPDNPGEYLTSGTITLVKT